MKTFRLFLLLLIISLPSSCASPLVRSIPTPLPEAYLPTVIALTLQAGNASLLPQATRTSAAVEESQHETEVPTPDLIPSSTPTVTPEAPAATPFLVTLPPPPTSTPFPDIPNADIQIYRPGDLSRVISPLQVSAYLRPGAVGRVRIELLGEDGRVLVRHIKEFTPHPTAWANLTLDLDFAITAAAELGRLVISVDDAHGRTMALNSVDLVLLSIGDADIYSADHVKEKIVIQQPTPKALVQGGTLLVSGLAHQSSDRPLMAQLITEDNRVVGQRLAGVTIPAEGGYGAFAVEVPYDVSTLTPVRLIVTEDGEDTSDIRYLSSLEIMLSP